MKRSVILACFILLSATLVAADPGALCIFSDAGGTECNIVDNGGMVQVYIVHAYADGAKAVQFKLDVSDAGWTHLSDSWNFQVAIGTSINGVSVAYGACLTSPIVVGSVSFAGASAPEGAAIRIVPDPTAEYVQVVDCEERTLYGAGGTAYVNSAQPCVCEPNPNPMLRVEPGSLDFGYLDSTRPLTIVNIGGGTLTWSVTESIPWLDVSSTSGTNTEEIDVTVDRSGLSPGTYSGTIDVSSNAGNESILVYMTVAPTEPILEVIPAELTFNGDQTDYSLIVRNVGIGDLNWSITSDQTWLSVSPASGIDDAAVNVSVDRTGLAGGTHHGNLTVTSNGGDVTVAVTLVVGMAILDVSPTVLAFESTQNTKPLNISNTGMGDLNWSITSDQTWLSASPSSGVNDANVSVFVDRTGLAEGTYHGNLIVTSDGGDATVAVTMAVPSPFPVLDVSPTSLAFSSMTSNKYLNVTNAGTNNLQWSITSDQPWLSVDPVSGTNDAQVAVNVDRTGLADGTYNGNLFVTSNGGDATVTVTMVVSPVSTEAGAICLFSDQTGTECNIVDAGALVQVHILHVGTDGASASQFRLDASAAGWIHLGDMWNFPIVIGTSVYGVAIAYNECLTSPIALGSAMFFGTSAPEGTPISIVPAPSVGSIEVVDCQFNLLPAAGGTAFVNANVPCVCGTNPNPVPVLYVSPLTLDFGDTDVSQTFAIVNTGGGTLSWNLSEAIPWLDVAPTGGANNQWITVTVDRSGLATGTHSGVINVTSNAGNETVTVTMNVPVIEPVLYVTPASLTFGSLDNDKSLLVSNIGTGDLEWSITSDQTWLSATPASGTNDVVVNVHVDRTGLTPGAYYGSLSVTSNGGDATVGVAMSVPVPNPILGVSPVALSFAPLVSDKPLNVSNTGTGDLEWSITPDQTWLSTTPASGTNDTQVNVHVDRTELADGEHHGNLSVTSNGGDATVPVDIWVGPQPILNVGPASLIFTPSVTTHTISITNMGDGTLEWTLSADKTWIGIVPPLSGTNNATVTVTVDPGAVPPGGVQVGHVTVSSNGGTLSVEVRFVPPGSSHPGAIGVFGDADAASCNITDTGGMIQVHVLHLFHGGAVASQFRLDISGVGWTYLSDTWDFPLAIGQSVNGVAIAYGACLPAPTHLGVISFLSTVAPACRYVQIVPDPMVPSGQIEAVDCAETKVFAQGLIAVVNPDAYCDCNAAAGVPVQETTWGRIKSMYAPERK
jgi:hypothetical protein